MADSICRQFAKWASNLTYEDLPPEVIDKVKALLLLHLVGAVAGAPRPLVRQWIELIKEEESKADGATILVEGSKVTRMGAASANALIVKGAGIQDSYRMHGHPGPGSISTGLSNAEVNKNTLKELITALAAGYEFGGRLSFDYTMSTMAQGFYSAALYSTMNAVVIAGKLLNLSEDNLVAAITLAAHGASAGLHESASTAPSHGGGAADRQHVLGSEHAARQGTLSALWASKGNHIGVDDIIEGHDGFFHSFAGSRDGQLSYVFEGPLKIDLNSITEGLGNNWRFLQTMFRIYNIPGMDQPVVELIFEMQERHGIPIEEIESVEIRMNHYETIFPKLDAAENADKPDLRDPHSKLFWDIRFFAAHALVNRGVPVVGGKTYGPTGKDLDSDQAVLDFMDHITITGVEQQAFFSPEMTVKMKDGRTFEGGLPFSRLFWSFDELVERLQDCVPGLPGGQERLDTLIDVMRKAEDLASVAPLFAAVGTL